jgi:N-acyl-D-amino-acid deacylase
VQTLLKNGLVVDGSGADGYRGDVRIVDDRLAEIGPDLPVADADEVLDVDGLVVAPGFIDIHTHYDAQITWDRDLTPSSWYGITTVVLGNCGFGIAPTRPKGREVIARTLENVEGMSYEALSAGIDWSFETFPEYLDALESGGSRLNIAAFVGHTPVRTYVMGEDASSRAATDAEIARMRTIVREAIDAGAIGFSSSREIGHWGAWGRPVPSRVATADEVMALASELTCAGRGIFGIVGGPDFWANDLPAVAARIARPVTFGAVLTGRGSGDKREDERRGKAMALLDQSFYVGSNVYPQITCRPIVHRVVLRDPVCFYKLQSFAHLLELPAEERESMYDDAAWRNEVIAEMNEKRWGESTWKNFSVAESVNHKDLVGIPLSVVAVQQGKHPFEVMVAVARGDYFQTRFEQKAANDDEVELAQLLNDDRTILGLSDAGAHASQLCDACFPTYLLSHWVRDLNVLSLEKAVWRMTGQPAAAYGFSDRGRLEPGLAADVVAFDATTVAHLPLDRVVDLPGGGDRLVARSVGVEHVWVNGRIIRRNGADILTNRARSAGRVIRDAAG